MLLVLNDLFSLSPSTYGHHFIFSEIHQNPFPVAVRLGGRVKGESSFGYLAFVEAGSSFVDFFARLLHRLSFLYQSMKRVEGVRGKEQRCESPPGIFNRHSSLDPSCH